MPARYVALLRAINVGGTGKIPMKDLALIFEKAGCNHVQTYIQSGNVVFECAGSLSDLKEKVTKALQKKFGFHPEIIFRKPGDLEEIVMNNPYLNSGADDSQLHVWFLNAPPSADEIAKLEKNRIPPDEFAVRGREIYFLLPNGAGKSKLAAVRLKTIATGRNWRTVNSLIGILKT